jgi:DNA-binding NtrC family response regulator
MEKKFSILVVDDEPDLLELLKRSLEPDLDCHVSTASSGKKAFALFSKNSFDLVLLDMKMPEMDGMELLELIRRTNPDQTVIMMTAYGNIDTAVNAMRNGAYDFITKPFDHDALLVRLEKALERSALIRENSKLKSGVGTPHEFCGLVGKSPAMQQVFEVIKMVASTDLTVLITGESGTGKDLTARAVHAMSGRRDKRYVAVNCPTVPEQILESELFGYKKGAFTHATVDRTGLFQEAHEGSIFLDEIGDVSPVIQTKLLRVIQEKEIKPLGDTRTLSVDVRVIASTNRDLKERIRAGVFREDFYYRLKVLPIELPPLRSRPEDIPLIANYLLQKHSIQLNRPGKTLAPELLEMLTTLPWKGNVRELENAIVQGILFSKNDIIMPQDISAGTFPTPGTGYEFSETATADMSYRVAKENLLHNFNITYIGRLLSETGGNVTRAAAKCKMERQSLQQVMRRYNINADDYRK